MGIDWSSLISQPIFEPWRHLFRRGGSIMRRLALVMSVLALMGGVLFAASSVVGAQDDEMSTEGHVLVGTWLADTDADDPSNPQEVFAFHDDGTYTSSGIGENGDSDVTLGAWRATGDRTAELTVVQAIQTGEDTYGNIVIRASIEVAEDGNSFTAPYTIELQGVPGAEGEYGPGTATGTRIAVESMGTPVGSLEDLFGQFEEEEGTPEATPTA
jgi:hypothetical protein